MQLTQQPAVNDFAAALQGARTAAGISQRALARRCGLTPAYVSLLEAGRRTPERATVDRLADALELPADQRAALVLAAGYAPAGATPEQRAGPLASVEALIERGPFTPQQRAQVTTLIEAYAQGLAARVRAGKPLVADLAAPWQARMLEAMQEKMAEDFESFRDAYMRPSFDL